MRNNEVEHIRRNMTSLINYTICNASLLSRVIEQNILTMDDVDVLDSIPVKTEKAFKFYQIIMTRENFYEPLLQALDECRQTGAAEILRRAEESSSSSIAAVGLGMCCGSVSTFESSRFNSNRSLIFFDISPPVPLFTGREQELIMIHSKLQTTQQTSLLLPQSVCIIGLGGIGKSELVREYINAHAPNFYKNVVWLPAESERSLSKGFKNLARDELEISLNNIDSGERNIQTVVDRVYNYFGDAKTLFVFDNATTGQHISKFMPFRVTKKPFLLITSRDNYWSLEVDAITLDKLSEEDAILFVKKGLNLQNTIYNNELRELVRKLQCFPLALQQAISYIRQQQLDRCYDVVNYMTEYQNNLKDRKFQLGAKINSPIYNTYRFTTFTTWEVTMKSIKADKEFGRAAQTLLYFMAYLGAEKIPANLLGESIKYFKPALWEIFEKLNLEKVFFGDINPTRVLQGALQLLIRYSLIHSHPNDGTISIHLLVQDVMKIQSCDKSEEKGVLNKTLRILESNLDGSCVTHAIHAFNYARKYPNFLRKKKHLILPRQIIYKLFQSGEALNHSSKELEILINHLGIDYTEIVRTKLIMATLETLYKMAEYATNSWIQQVNATLEGGNYPTAFVVDEKIRQSMNELGRVVKCLQKFRLTVEGKYTVKRSYVDQSPLHKHFMEKLRSFILPHYNKTDATLNELRAQQRNFVFREGQADQSFRGLKKIFSKGIIKTERVIILDSRYSEKAVDHAVSKNSRARNIEHICYEMWSNVIRQQTLMYGENPVETWLAINLLGKLHSDFGRYEQAVTMHIEVYNNFRHLLGDSHRNTLSAKFDVAFTQFKMRNNVEALALFKEVIETESIQFGREHEEVWYTKFFLAQIYIEMMRDEEAASLLYEVGSRFAERYGLSSFQYKEVEQLSKTINNRRVRNNNGISVV